ncbi:hypothetical protein ACWDBW_37930 [Streptomyces sp. NPDC001107]
MTEGSVLALVRGRPGRTFLSPDRLRRQRRRLGGGLGTASPFRHSTHDRALGEQLQHAGHPRLALPGTVGNATLIADDTSPEPPQDSPASPGVLRAPPPSPTAQKTPPSTPRACGPVRQ